MTLDTGAELVFNLTVKGNSLGAKDWSPNPVTPGGSINSGLSEWYVGFGSNGSYEALGGHCASFTEVLDT